MTNAHTVLVYKPELREILGDLDVDEKIVWRQILRNQISGFRVDHLIQARVLLWLQYWISRLFKSWELTKWIPTGFSRLTHLNEVC
jgi:hypothetical protein